ncbi:MAG: 5'-nucleotidase C-terminal domain-containing protein [Betaproteobacteria bacterium]|nr:5'-nucleotidase C-terminal domain-containing protein [Betaproteobacteria bacterium]
MRRMIVIMLMLLAGCASIAGREETQVALIHIGDIHGHMVARPNLRSDSAGRMEGGLARMYTKIEELRARHPHHVLANTGDTIQGSAEALYTRGEALVNVLNAFAIDVYTPGNWEFVYGTQRFLELFAGERPMAPWNTVAANVYYDGEPYAARSGQRVLPPYVVKTVGGVRIGFLGLTTDRGPQVVGRAVTRGFRFLRNTPDELDAEVSRQVAQLRTVEKVDVLVMLSEMGVANNLRLAEKIPGIDVVLSSDMHEVTREPVVAKTGTLIVEEGQDGTVVGELVLAVKAGKIERWSWKSHRIDDSIPESARIAALVARERASFVSGPQFKPHVNPFNGTALARPIDAVVGHTQVALHRSNFSGEPMPAVIEGTAHDFLTDAFRAQANADVGAIRGFRYGTHVAPGPIRMEDLYHFIPIGPMIAKGKVKGRQLRNQIEASADGSLNPDVARWTGGWLFNFSGLTLTLDPYGDSGKRTSDIRVLDRASGAYKPLDPEADYTYASYFYRADPNLINVVEAREIEVLQDANGRPLDGVEVVVRYLESLPQRTANPEQNRIRLARPLPPPAFGSPEVQPWRGATRPAAP